MSSKVMSLLLISALMVRCTTASPRARADSGVMSEAGYEREQGLERLDGDTFYPSEEERVERHADGIFNTNYRKALGQLTARKYLHSLVAKRVGGGSSSAELDLSKRHADGVFTNGYSQYRSKMAVRKYLSAVLGTSPEDVELPLAVALLVGGLELGEEPVGEEMALWALLGERLTQVPPQTPSEN
ncbi:glucagon family neuropeptides-like [Engraulis encrasicolus]|uniref:glucagon family neuropeptides-like n=1 Tax=Engraulis encrasicolus TaxID=184585 RepID=UPI002FD2962A